jgi:hypothetical protein
LHTIPNADGNRKTHADSAAAAYPTTAPINIYENKTHCPIRTYPP